jgi:hypothetical protein
VSPYSESDIWDLEEQFHDMMNKIWMTPGQKDFHIQIHFKRPLGGSRGSIEFGVDPDILEGIIKKYANCQHYQEEIGCSCLPPQDFSLFTTS